MTPTARYAIAQHTDHYPIIDLYDRETNSAVSICPERGGIVTAAKLHGHDLLYLDKDTFYDPSANIRGGIPVLFPICGQLRHGQYEWEGITYAMANHGVARNRSWLLETADADDQSAWATLVLRSSPDTLASYPFAFELTFTYRLQDGHLTIEQAYRNLSDRTMPMIAGFHPYFATTDKHLPYRTDATQYLDYNDGQVKPYVGTLNLNGLKESVALLDATKPEVSFPLRDGVAVHMSYSEQFRYVVLWTVEGKPFVCVEPWTALNEALNDKQGLLEVLPGETLSLSLAIACGPA